MSISSEFAWSAKDRTSKRGVISGPQRGARAALRGRAALATTRSRGEATDHDEGYPKLRAVDGRPDAISLPYPTSLA